MNENIKCLKKICEEVNDAADCSIKTGIQYKNNSLVIYDSNNYDDMFGHQVLSTLNVDEDELEKDYYTNQLKTELIQKICKITGKPIAIETQKQCS